jgi:hypothetical protein
MLNVNGIGVRGRREEGGMGGTANNMMLMNALSSKDAGVTESIAGNPRLKHQISVQKLDEEEDFHSDNPSLHMANANAKSGMNQKTPILNVGAT